MEHYDSIIRAREVIKKKFNDLRRGETETAEVLERVLRPVSEPLKEIVRSSSKQVSPPPSSFLPSSFDDDDKTNVKQELTDRGDHDDHLGEVNDYVGSNFGPRVGPYFHDMIVRGSDFDHTYGVRIGRSGNWCIGKEPIYFLKDDTFRIAGETFSPTPGLLELVFKKAPAGYSDGDLQKYKRILQLTNAHRKDNKPGGKLISGRSNKYHDIIRELFPPKSSKKKGSGLFLPNTQKSYVYWDDPNELVERLDVLIASKKAGNTGLEREILSIITELKEARCIE